jgi:HlyD family secretion protein
VTYDVVVDVSNPGLRLKPGMTANVTFTYAKRDDVLRLRNTALRFRPPPELASTAGGGARAKDRPGGGEAAHGTSLAASSERRRVWLLRAGAPVAVPVRVGISDGTYTEIQEGALRAGDEVIVEVTGATEPPKGMGPPPGRGVIRRL